MRLDGASCEVGESFGCVIANRVTELTTHLYPYMVFTVQHYIVFTV